MKNLLVPAIILGCTLLSCTTTKPNKTNKGSAAMCEESENMTGERESVEKVDYLTKNQLKNGFAADCPGEVSAQRSGVALGQVKHVTYYSNTCKCERGFNILLPASYDGEKKYPVIYFQHGIFCDENSIIHDGNNKIREICANLAADGYAKEVIIVFGNMYASADPKLKPGFNAESVLPYDNFINELINDLMPYVESNFAVLTGRENTAICGFSMGGRETLFMGLQRSDLFGYIGAIAPAPGLVPGKDWAMTHVGQLSEENAKFAEDAILPEVLMVCCGTQDGTVGQFPKSYHKLFEKNGVEHIWFEVIGADHNAHAIRTGFYQFMTRVFK
ncbi:MAG: hypothetical protein MJ188_01375 [Treponema sp.]|nr:hypothetical protein [Treponema sp.]